MTVALDPIAFDAFAASIKPMLATPQKPGTTTADHPGWWFDTKLDGIRVLAFWNGRGPLVLRNRSGRDISHRFPELDFSAAETLGPIPVILDGEVVAQSGSFQDTARRDKQTKPLDVLNAMKLIPITYVAFDVLYMGAGDVSGDLRNQPYSTRRAVLDGLPLAEDSIWTRSVVSQAPGFFETVKALGMEGVIAKHPRSRYRAGRFSDWTKFKATRTLTAIGYGYENGTGARAHFGAMFLALLDTDGSIVQIGRVGTGFDAAEIDHLKATLDAKVPVVVEIECLNKSKDGQLRFPVYKGLRTDLSVTDARLDQLDDIPTM